MEKQQCINSLEACSVLRSTSLLMHKAPRTLHSTEQSGSSMEPLHVSNQATSGGFAHGPATEKFSTVARVPRRFGEETDWSL